MFVHYVVMRKHRTDDEWKASCVCGQSSIWGSSAYAGSWKGQHLHLNERWAS